MSHPEFETPSIEEYGRTHNCFVYAPTLNHVIIPAGTCSSV